jgi:hypothetical protein
MFSFGKSFYEFCEKHSIGRSRSEMIGLSFKSEFLLHKIEFEFLREKGIVFDGKNGGLVLGKSHKNGGIHLLRFLPEKGLYKYEGEMEGFEYLSSPLKNELQLLEFEKINEIDNEKILYKEFTLPENCEIISTNAVEIAIIELSEFRQFIVNGRTTVNRINNIIEIDKKY